MLTFDHMSALLRYQTFPSPELAQPLLELLEKHRIAFDTSYARETFNAALGLTMPALFEVKLLPGDFEKVRALETETNRHLLAEIAPDHYLFTFTDAELFDILAKADEWSNFDVTLAEQLLQERGHVVTPEQVRFLRQYRVAELSQPAPSSYAWILFGYVLAAAGGLLALFIGLHLQHRKVLPDGQQVPAFSPEDRKHGKQIIALSILSTLIWLGVFIWYQQ
jgi:hypothetical protein